MRRNRRKKMAITKAFVLHSSTKLKHLLTIIWEFFTDYSLSGVTNQFNIKISFVCWVSTIQQLFHTKEFKNSLQKKEEERKKKKNIIGATGCNFLQFDTNWYNFCYTYKVNFYFLGETIQIYKFKITS